MRKSAPQEKFNRYFVGTFFARTIRFFILQVELSIAF